MQVPHTMSLYKREGSDVWWTEFQAHGRRYRQTTGRRDKREAQTEERRLRAKARAAPRDAARPEPLRELAKADSRRAKAAGNSDAWISRLEDLWVPIIGSFGDRDPAKLTYDDIEAYVLHRRRLGFKGQTIIREIAALKRGLSIARRQGAIATMLTEWPPIKRDPPNQSRRGKLHSPAIIAEVFKFLTPTTRDGCMFALLTGIRYQELRRVMATWVEPAPQGASVPAVLRLPAEGTKTRRERIVGLSQPALEIVQRNIGRTPLFPQVNYAKALAEACKKAKYTPVITLRDLRHTYATLATLGTGDVRATQAALGHMDLATTERYLSSTTIRTLDSSAEVAKAIK